MLVKPTMVEPSVSPFPPLNAPTTKEAAEAWVMQFAARHHLDPFGLTSAASLYATTGDAAPLGDFVRASGCEWYSVPWREFWWVYTSFINPCVDPAVR